MSTTETQNPETVPVSLLHEEVADWTIFQRVAAIVAEMPAIGKGQRNTQQNFMYRGHDDVMNALNPLLSRYGVFFVPRVIERLTAERKTARGGTMYEVNLHVEYTFWCAASDPGLRNASFVASAWGEGTDSGDKSTNKAMTMALKNVLAQVFAVSTAEQAALDTDRGHPEETTGRGQAERQTARVWKWSDEGFDPAVHIDHQAPRNWDEMGRLMMTLDHSLANWLSAASSALYGVPTAELTAEQTHEAGIRAANALSRIAEELFADGDFPPPTDEQYQAVLAWAFGGVLVEVPGPFEGLSEEEALLAAEEAAAASEADEPTTEPLIEPDDPGASQGHTGTASPDE